jgi:hypothetical protein
VTTLKAGAYQSLQTGDTFSHVGILDPALWTVVPLTFSLVQLSPLPLIPCVNKYSKLLTYTVCGGGYGVLGLRDKHLQQSPFNMSIFFNDHILHCLLWILSFYGVDIYCSCNADAGCREISCRTVPTIYK